MKQIFIFLILLTLLTTFVCAEYPNTYYNDGMTETDGYFSSTTTETTETTPLSAGKFVPYIADFDNDGSLEVMIVDGGNLEFYENITIDSLDAY